MEKLKVKREMDKPVFAGFIRMYDGREFPPDQVPEELIQRMMKVANEVLLPKGSQIIHKV